MKVACFFAVVDKIMPGGEVHSTTVGDVEAEGSRNVLLFHLLIKKTTKKTPKNCGSLLQSDRK